MIRWKIEMAGGAKVTRRDLRQLKLGRLHVGARRDNTSNPSPPADDGSVMGITTRSFVVLLVDKR